MKLIITGDFVVTDDFQGQKLIDESVKDLFEKADYRIVNLEAPITPNNPKNKILKTGPHLRTSSETIFPYLKQLNVNMVTLANNHILDYGQQGLKDTLEFCTDNNISTVGAGENLNVAKEPYRLELNGKIISILNFAENEWASATNDSGGANPMDLIGITRIIKAEKKEVDHIIVIIHGGQEYVKYPSPLSRKYNRYIADCGADIVLSHHTHCIGYKEIYNQVPIYYGLGNFLFTITNKTPVWYRGLIVNIDLSSFKIKEHLVNVCSEFTDNSITVTNDKKYNNKFSINDDNEINKKWCSEVISKDDSYYTHLSPVNIFRSDYLRRVSKKLSLDNHLISNSQAKNLLNLIRCESHREAFVQILENKIKDE